MSTLEEIQSSLKTIADELNKVDDTVTKHLQFLLASQQRGDGGWTAARQLSNSLAVHQHDLEFADLPKYLQRLLNTDQLWHTLEGTKPITQISKINVFSTRGAGLTPCDRLNMDEIAIRANVTLALPGQQLMATLHLTIRITFAGDYTKVISRAFRSYFCNDTGERLQLLAPYEEQFDKIIDGHLLQVSKDLDDQFWNVNLALNGYLDPLGSLRTNPHHFGSSAPPASQTLRHEWEFVASRSGAYVSVFARDELERYFQERSSEAILQWKTTVVNASGSPTLPTAESRPELPLIDSLPTRPSWDFDVAIKIRVSFITLIVDYAIAKFIRENQPQGGWLQYKGIVPLVNPTAPSQSGYFLILEAYFPLPRYCQDWHLVIQGPWPWNWYFECHQWSSPIGHLPVLDATAIFNIRQKENEAQLLLVGTAGGKVAEVPIMSIPNAAQAEVQFTAEVLTIFVRYR